MGYAHVNAQFQLISIIIPKDIIVLSQQVSMLQVG